MMNNASSERRYRAAEAKLWNHYGVRPTEKYVCLDRLKLRVRVQELGEGAPLLFLHGNPSAGATWAPLVAKLTDYRCLLLDVPGHGLSDPIPDDMQGTQALLDLSTDTIGSVIETLEHDKVTLVASSGGGAMAYWYALAKPQRVERIVQLGTPASLEGSTFDVFTRLLTIPHLNRMLLRLMPVNLKTTRSMYTQIGHGPAIEDGRIPTCFLEWALHLTADTHTMAGTLDLTEAGMTWRGIRPGAVIGQAELARITQPTQYIWSEGDPFGGASLAQETARRTPNSELHLLPGSGHLPWLDATNEVADMIRSFLQSLQMPSLVAAAVGRV